MNEREEAITFVMEVIHNLCVKYDIGLVPYELKNGKYVVAINDTLNDKTYVMTKDN